MPSIKQLVAFGITVVLLLPQAICSPVAKRLSTGKHSPQGGSTVVQYTDSSNVHWIKNFHVRKSDNAIMQSVHSSAQSTAWVTAPISPPTYAQPDGGLASTMHVDENGRQVIHLFYQETGTNRPKSVSQTQGSAWTWDTSFNNNMGPLIPNGRPQSALTFYNSAQHGRNLRVYIFKPRPVPGADEVHEMLWNPVNGWVYKGAVIRAGVAGVEGYLVYNLSPDAAAVQWNNGNEISIFFFSPGLRVLDGVPQPTQDWVLLEMHYSASTGSWNTIPHRDTESWTGYSPGESAGSVTAIAWQNPTNGEVNIRVYPWGDNLWELSFSGVDTSNDDGWQSAFQMGSVATSGIDRYGQISAVYWPYPLTGAENNHIRLYEVRCATSACTQPYIYEVAFDSGYGWQSGGTVAIDS